MALDPAAMRQRLEDGLTQLDVAFDAHQVQRLLRYLALLSQWNQVYNLTAVRDPSDMLAVHLLDSLSILPLVDRYARKTMLDVGSGAGLPAIPLTLMRDLIIWSIDAVAKKVSFQLQVKGNLGLDALHPIHARVEAARLPVKPSLIVSRAFTDLSNMLGLVDRHADADTTVIAMKGVTPAAELAAIPPSWTVKDVVPLNVPFLGAERCAVVLMRASPAAIH